LIEITIEKNKEENIKSIVVKGHSPSIFGKKGENTLCAGISIMTQSYAMFLSSKKSLDILEIDNGYLKLSIETPNREDTLSFSALEFGLKSLEKDFPDILQVHYI
jgi:uncharacterized protein YsxB (DUF464 family)